MMFKRVVIIIGAILMLTGMALSTTANYLWDDVVEIGTPVVCEITKPEYTTTRTPETFKAEDHYFQPTKMTVKPTEPVTTMNVVYKQEPIEEKTTMIVVATEPAEKPKKEDATEKVKEEAIKPTEVEEKHEEQKATPLKEGTIVDPSLDASAIVLEDYTWDGEVLDSYNGTVKGPNGKETYYNLNMSGVIQIMKDLGYNYEYSVRSDGVKMYGPFIMVAADLSMRPRGSIIKTSLGWAMVCDTGAFVEWNPYQLDIAAAW